MTLSKLAPFAAALVLLTIAGHANAATQRKHGEFIKGQYSSTFDSTYRDPTTREALDEGLW